MTNKLRELLIVFAIGCLSYFSGVYLWGVIANAGWNPFLWSESARILFAGAIGCPFIVFAGVCIKTIAVS